MDADQRRREQTEMAHAHAAGLLAAAEANGTPARNAWDGYMVGVMAQALVDCDADPERCGELERELLINTIAGRVPRRMIEALMSYRGMAPLTADESERAAAKQAEDDAKEDDASAEEIENIYFDLTEQS